MLEITGDNAIRQPTTGFKAELIDWILKHPGIILPVIIHSAGMAVLKPVFPNRDSLDLDNAYADTLQHCRFSGS
jgi:hypothetical protein